MLNTTWWNDLEPQWKQAFGVGFFGHETAPNTEELAHLYAASVLRLVGPKAPYPNMGFELTNLSGIAQLSNLEILVVTHHQIKNIQSLKNLKKLKSVFLFNNQIDSLEGLETLTLLEQLYIQFNNINSLKALKELTCLKELYANNNALSSLEGLTEAHSDTLNTFFCKPNDLLKQKEIIYVENQLGIKCRGI